MLGYFLTRRDHLPEEVLSRGELDTTHRTEETIENEHATLFDNGTIQYPGTMSGGERVSYETLPFEEWVDLQCRMVAPHRIKWFLRNRLDLPHETPTVTYTYGTPIESDRQPGVLVEYEIVTDRSAERKVRPTIDSIRDRRS